jgi:hypothetical protein
MSSAVSLICGSVMHYVGRHTYEFPLRSPGIPEHEPFAKCNTSHLSRNVGIAKYLRVTVV